MENAFPFSLKFHAMRIFILNLEYTMYKFMKITWSHLILANSCLDHTLLKHIIWRMVQLLKMVDNRNDA